MQAVRTRHGRIGVGVAVAMLGLAGLVGCTMVGESLNGVSLTREDVANCQRSCNSDAQELMRAEQQTHQENIDSCLSLEDGAKADCLNAEGARHSAAVQSIADGKRECHNNCHNQGRGSAG